MSWKGFSKAVTRLPTRLAQRTGYASETVDQEYQELEAQFKRLEGLARKFHEDAKKFKDSLSAMLAHQAQFAETLVQIYRPIAALPNQAPPRSGIDALEDEVLEEDTRAASPSKQKSDHPQSQAAAEAFAEAMIQAREQLLPELQVIERQMVAPTNDYIMLINNVKRLMEKRARKLVDYDRHRDSVMKLKNKPDKNLSDEKRLSSLETSLDQATREFNNVDNILKQELPVFLGLRVGFIDPCFQTLYWYELKVVQILHERFDHLCKQHFDMSISAAAGFDAKYEEMMSMLTELTLAKRPYRRTDSAVEGEEGGPQEQKDSGAGRTSDDAVGSEEVLPAYEIEAPTKSYIASPSASTGGFRLPAAAPGPSTVPRASYVIALYDFEGAEEGDLTFKKDDKIEVIRRTEDTNDWWSGKCKGVTGQFPGNYVCEL
ncbi:hypothetical protein PhCBS80983_g01789 [Powellomyces hirtus]|uniref:SH3 domain-containing protein n=1 Tax=Powellomyces hirtus TaxID=109895 RepID=A0A507E9C1_9FUNG|nr:hypothetical protein DFJ77DRAFT_507333 [Powellomyces hirtus]TPX60406.1 hypothetical protein PhCBS80983_g01789 [Powellomyces hirtus]